MKRIPGLAFSWKRAVGISVLKQNLARGTGFPLTKMGLERKVGSMVLKTLLMKKR
ncbi:MAG: hypothetical protein IK041_06035 [Bacteroidales bacterium]|nr:hypothetical protein [Bacteroidales bacterium]